MDSRDRRAALLQSASFNGIDFVEVFTDDETVLRVHFLNDVPLQGTLSATPTIDGGETIRSVAVNPISDATDWELDGDHLVLWLTVAAPGDFSNYTLTLQSAKLDPFFASAVFSFKARCPSDLDCKETTPLCPSVEADVPPIDYLAKDFLSFRQALLDFSSLRYPEWQERSEADFGVMFAEALSVVADDLSYTQDRIAAEATLETATQRRSIVRHARLVDYEPRPATAARVMLQFDVGPGVTQLPDGLLVSAVGPDGTSIAFETGGSLAARMIDPVKGGRLDAPPMSVTNPAWNTGVIQPYWFDDSERCLRAGATDMYVLGQGYGFFPGQPLLIETVGATSADPPIRQIVHLVKGIPPTEICDPLFRLDVAGNSQPDPPYFTCVESPPAATAPTAVTRIFWESADKLVADRDLTRTTLAGNLIPASQGLTLRASDTARFSEQSSETFAVPKPFDNPRDISLAIARTGPNDTAEDPSLQWFYTLRNAPIAWLQPDDADAAPLPEILVTLHGVPSSQAQWRFLRRLLDAEDFDNAFTLDAARFSDLGRNSDGSNQYDYDGDGGDTIRFGDGTFGEIPDDGVVFDVTYRVGGGAIGNVAADAIMQISPAGATAGVIAVTNPLPATGGDDAEALDRVRRLAPQAFRAEQFRAVLPKDYQDAAKKKLPWVQQAGTVFRWTGSWLTVFTTADPLHSEEITVEERTELINLLNRYRLSGYESYVPEARYVSIDLVVELCAQPDAFRGDVEDTVITALSSKTTAGAPAGFFDPDHFTFGQSLERSDLEAAVQNAHGVAGVMCVLFRVRNRTAGFAEMPDVVAVATDEIIRCDNDPSFPEHGSLKITIRGGK
jgi:hypothetical protein